MFHATGKEVTFAIVICLSYMKAVANPCPASIPTLVEVPRCPRDKSEWDQAASRKQCHKIAAIQKCTDPEKFVYHCLLNEWTNGTVEICAPTWFISGYCAMYSVQEERIKESTSLDCTNFTDPCGARYTSSDAYMYQSCYQEIKKMPTYIPGNLTILKIILRNPVFIVSTVGIVILAAFTGIAVYIICRKICKVCRHDNEKPSTEEPETEILMIKRQDGLKPAPGYGDNGSFP
ncbi:uncharacterized protein LOC125674590 [Ostrea edulis]|uniref:uncharacterized protein LOC125674590 n=1 Tax=Ostrea edulis TaxID=37623 RepID=UPI0024AF3B10|nr:uncharacterized protein LOC125674590 [Ostrea edulis]